MVVSKKEILVLVGVAVLFLALRVPALHLLYHQDEYKWPQIVLGESGEIPHPPVGEFIYKTLGGAFGADNFRYIPFIFSILNLFLIFYLAKTISGTKAAFWTAFLFAISFYSVLASVMVDTDGAVMPFFFLLSAIGYYKFKSGNNKWFTLLLVSLVLGFLVKTSFIIAIGAFILDFLIEKQVFQDWKKLAKYLACCIVALGALALLVFLSKFIFPFFNLESSVKYWEHFVKFGGRGWLQTLIQFAKSLLYTSPLLLAPIFFINREIWQKTRVFFLFIGLGLVFYLLLFDFSLGALDRYFQFLVVPLCIISGAILAQVFSNREERVEKKDILFVSIISVAVFVLQFFNHFVPGLYPKTEWLDRIIHLKWQFLFPFTGGSGPTGFYVSFLFMALIWIVCLLFGLSYLKMQRWQMGKRALFGILVLGLIYNTVFVEEYLWGKINGSPYRLFQNAKEFIAKDSDIKKVVVYNDIGGYEIQQIGKYERRLYAAPQFVDSTYRVFFNTFDGHVLYINIPRIDPSSFYASYLASCREIYNESDRYIQAKVLECKK